MDYAGIFWSILVKQKHQALSEHFSGIFPKINSFPRLQKIEVIFFFLQKKQDLI